MTPQEAERQELDRAIELLGRRTRPGRLLEYLGARYFAQQEAQLTEFNIATEVFGRSEKNFDATEDAVVRVEAHRLRKKLKELYGKTVAPRACRSLCPPAPTSPGFHRSPARRPQSKNRSRPRRLLVAGRPGAGFSRWLRSFRSVWSSG
jgi:hypothetical protein